MALSTPTRDAILDAARTAMAEDGRAASMRRIAASAGITHAAIYKYFTDKDALLGAIAEDDFALLVEQIRSAVPVDAPPLARLHAALAQFIEAGLDNPNLFEFLFWTLPAEHSVVAKTNEVFLLIRSAVAAGTGGVDAEDTETEHIAGFLVTAAIGYVARRFVRPTTARERVDEYVAFLLGGLT